MEALIFFFLLPLAGGAIQYPLARSRLPRRLKWAPAALVAAVGLVCLGGMTGRLPLPDTYYFDRHSFLAFPDYWYIALFCLPVLFGLGLGAFFSMANSGRRDKEESL